MKSTHPTITVGLSVNAEQSLVFEEQSGEKGKLVSIELMLGGSSANVAAGLRNLGKMSNLLVPMTINPSDKNELLEICLRKSGLQRTPLMILEDAPFAVVPSGSGMNSKNLLFGTKGVPTTKISLIEKAEEEIIKLDGQWRIATGVDKNVGVLADNLLGGEENKGYRTFSPHHSFCKQKDHRKFLEKWFLTHSDLLAVNDDEFSHLGISIDKMHEYGISIVVVTAAEKGGTFSICNQATGNKRRSGTFNAVPVKPPLYKVGAGDWFLAGLMSNLIDYNHEKCGSLLTTDPEALKEACEFAAKVSAKKITMKGPANGPTWRDFNEVKKTLVS